MPDQWISVIARMPSPGPMMWVLEVKSRTVVTMTPSASVVTAHHASNPGLRTESEEFHWEACELAIETGQMSCQLEWVKYSGSWRKLAYNKIPVDKALVLNHVMDITHLDPRAEWVSRIDLQTQRLQLKNGKSLSYAEVSVMHYLVKGLTHKAIAENLNISPKTVDYRISRLKMALDVETTVDMMLAISDSGLIHLATVPLELANPVRSETELYKMLVG